MWTCIGVLRRRARRHFTICCCCWNNSSVCYTGSQRPVLTRRVYSAQQTRNIKIKTCRFFFFKMAASSGVYYQIWGYSIFTMLSQEANPGWDSGQVPVCRDKNKLSLRMCDETARKEKQSRGWNRRTKMRAVTVWKRRKRWKYALIWPRVALKEQDEAEQRTAWSEVM